VILTFVVYFVVLLIVVPCGYIVSRNNEILSLRSLFVLFPIVAISIIAGFRYQVGTDWESYCYAYEQALISRLSFEAIMTSTMEPLYIILNVVVAFLQIPYQFFFAVVMLIHLLFLYKSFKDYVWLLPLGLFFYFVSVFTTSLNIQRQTLSFCIFLFAINYYRNGNFMKYIVTVLIASCFHYSSLILFPVFFLRCKCFSFLNNRFIGISLYLISFLLFEYVLNLINITLTGFVTNAKYLSNMSFLGNTDMEVNSGLGILIFHLIDLLIIMYSVKLSKYFECVNFKYIYRAFIIGVILANIFGNDLFLSRVPFALENLRFLMLAFLTYYMLKRKTTLSYLCALSLITINLCTFIMAILNGHSGCSPYQFA
jgi:hypothetical protein